MRVMILLLGLVALPALADPSALAAVNSLRSNAERGAITYDPALERAAASHARDMAQNRYFSHEGLNGSSVGDRLHAQGYKWCFAAENIAQGQKSLQSVMQSWAGSKGHHRNMVHAKVRAMGLARAEGDVWVMVLAAPC